MTEKTITRPRRVYSKSSAFYTDTKSDFFSSNESLLAKAEKQNELYLKQPIRTKCKICSQALSSDCDFISHQVQYIFCDGCGHLNGAYEDTKAFVENLYFQAEGDDYAINYLDAKYVERTNNIYLPKVDFLLNNLPSKTELKLLDVGCGAGYFVYAAILRGIDATGIDVSQTMIEFGNQQISHLQQQRPLTHSSESDFFESIANSDAKVISAIGVIEHLRDPQAFFDAFQQSEAQYLYYSVPMFSFSVMLENIFTDVFPRQLSGGHTHLFTEQSINWLYENYNLNSLAEWRFGTDIMDLYRTMSVEMIKKGASTKLEAFLKEGLAKNIDQLQAVFDEKHFCSEIHCLAVKR